MGHLMWKEFMYHSDLKICNSPAENTAAHVTLESEIKNRKPFIFNENHEIKTCYSISVTSSLK